MTNLRWNDLLRHHPFFLDLDRDQIERILGAEVSEERNYPEGAVILEEGEFDDSIYLIGTGSVQVVRKREDGGEVSLAVLKRGEFFGEMAIFEHKPRAASVLARENCVLLKIKGAEFLRVLTEHPDLAFKVLSERLRQTNDNLIASRMKSIDEKIGLLNSRLDAETKTIDAKLTAAAAVFEQTKIRTDEVILSAERSRTRLTTAVSTIGGIVAIAVTLFGWLGFSEIINIRKEADKIEETKTKVQSMGESIEATFKKVEKDLGNFDELRTLFYRDLMLPAFKEWMNRDQEKAKSYFKAILQTENPEITDSLFKEIQRLIYIEGTDRNNATEILTAGLDEYYLNTPRQHILTYYMILASLVLDGEKKYKSPRFKEIFEKYQKYASAHEAEKMRESLRRTLDLSAEGLDKFLPLSREQKDWLSRIERLIP